MAFSARSLIVFLFLFLFVVVHLNIACAMTSSSVIGPGHKEFRGQAPLQKLGFKIYQPIFSNNRLTSVNYNKLIRSLIIGKKDTYTQWQIE